MASDFRVRGLPTLITQEVPCQCRLCVYGSGEGVSVLGGMLTYVQGHWMSMNLRELQLLRQQLQQQNLQGPAAAKRPYAVKRP